MAQTSTTNETGSISYVTSQNVYVKFNSTNNISIGDTLFKLDNSILTAILVVQNTSSTSAVCIPLTDKKLSISDEVVYRLKQSEATENVVELAQEVVPVEDTTGTAKTTEEKSISEVNGRISASAYFINSNQAPDYNLRMRYVFMLDALHINNSKVSFESYISFTHKNNQWDLIKQNVYNGLKIYNLSVNYEFNETTQLWFGRRINRRLSSVGAIDGLQFEKKFGNITSGLVVGSRPDWQYYNVNPNLFQVGGYISHDYQSSNGKGEQTTLSIMEQKNHGNSDRRFLYFQHSNWLVKNLYFFGSGEIDLFKKIGEVSQNTFDLTNFYLSLRYQIAKPLRVSISYSQRSNIIYYETYKDIIDRLTNSETFQGYGASVNYSPFKRVSIGLRGSYRFKDNDVRDTRNLYSYITFSQVPFLKMSVTIYNTFLETSYIKGNVYGIRLNRDIVRGKLYGGLNYRYTKYDYYSSKTSLARQTIQLDLNYRIIKDLNLSANYELSLEGSRNYNYVSLNLTKRF